MFLSKSQVVEVWLPARQHPGRLLAQNTSHYCTTLSSPDGKDQPGPGLL